LLLTACGRILSVEPLSRPSDSLPDREVDGAWWAVSKKGEFTPEALILIVSTIGRDSQEALYIEHLPGKVLRSTKFYLYPTTIGGRTFASVKLAPSVERNLAEKEFETNFTFVTYSVISDRLRISELNFDVFERGVRSGALKGSVKHADFAGNRIALTDSTENIRRLIEENLDKIRDEKNVIEFGRVELKPKYNAQPLEQRSCQELF
jgi:hypothetical protein